MRLMYGVLRTVYIKKNSKPACSDSRNIVFVLTFIFRFVFAPRSFSGCVFQIPILLWKHYQLWWIPPGDTPNEAKPN
jgi:hypothetical protein